MKCVCVFVLIKALDPLFVTLIYEDLDSSSTQEVSKFDSIRFDLSSFTKQTITSVSLSRLLSPI